MNVAPIQPRRPAAELTPEQLTRDARLSEPEKIAEACRHFEALLLRQILRDTQKAVIPSSFTDTSTAACIYRDMVTERLAESISKSGALGLARTLEAQLQRPEAAPGKLATGQEERASSLGERPGSPIRPARSVSAAHE